MTSPEKPASGGVELTDEVLDRLVEEAEEGYDVERIRPRPRRGRPPLGSEAAAPSVDRRKGMPQRRPTGYVDQRTSAAAEAVDALPARLDVEVDRELLTAAAGAMYDGGGDGAVRFDAAIAGCSLYEGREALVIKTYLHSRLREHRATKAALDCFRLPQTSEVETVLGVAFGLGWTASLDYRDRCEFKDLRPSSTDGIAYYSPKTRALEVLRADGHQDATLSNVDDLDESRREALATIGWQVDSTPWVATVDSQLAARVRFVEHR